MTSASIRNPFAQPDAATVAAAVSRLNQVSAAWGHGTLGTGTTKRRAPAVLKRTKRTRYIVLSHDPMTTSDAERYVSLEEAIAIAGGQDRLIGAVANGYVPIVVAPGAEYTFLRADAHMLRNAFGPPVVAVPEEAAPKPAPAPAKPKRVNRVGGRPPYPLPGGRGA